MSPKKDMIEVLVVLIQQEILIKSHQTEKKVQSDHQRIFAEQQLKSFLYEHDS